MRNIDSDQDRALRSIELAAEGRRQEDSLTAAADAARRQNKDFTQVYSKGWKRLQSLIKTDPPAARLYAFLAEHIDGSVGAVVVSQAVLAEELGIHERTVRRLTKSLEDASAIVRIRVGTGVYAYALDPEEVWKSWNDNKKTAAFTTKTLARKADRENGDVRRKLKLMLGGPGAGDE